MQKGDRVKVSETAVLTGYEHMQEVTGPHPKVGQVGTIEMELEAKTPAFVVVFDGGETWTLRESDLEPAAHHIEIKDSIFSISGECISAVNDALTEIRDRAPEHADTRPEEIRLRATHCEACEKCEELQ